ncbi:MAG TPA: hypothetical protein VMW80_05405 [Candidatus Dormibacteraeota bacterium]|nr:hypothetical protein [Candidatus Dormibacteraeota bacterium]
MSSSDESAALRVGLLSQDLLVRSRVETGLGGHGVKLEMITGQEPVEVFDLLLVDLNREQEKRLTWLSQATLNQPSAGVICFGPHTEMAKLSPRAKAAGANSCVANSHLDQTLQRWLRSGGGAPPRPRRATA